MSDNDIPDVAEIKERLKIEEEDLAPEEGVKAESSTIVDQLQDLGIQVADTLRSAWESEERQKVEEEVREGVKSFANEIDKAIHDIRDGQTGQRIKEEATNIKSKVETGELVDKAKTGVVQGLRWLSDELGKLAEQFTLKEGSEETPTKETPETEA